MIVVGGKAYELVQEHKDAWKPDAFKERYSEVLERYDYIVGDWGYNQLRLKGFFKEGSGKATKDSTITTLQDYIQEYCNFGCAYFVLKRIPLKHEQLHSARYNPNDTDSSGLEDSAPLSGQVKLSAEETRPSHFPGGFEFSDRKPYSWREHQSSARHSPRASDHAADDKTSDTNRPREEGASSRGREGSGGFDSRRGEDKRNGSPLSAQDGGRPPHQGSLTNERNGGRKGYRNFKGNHNGNGWGHRNKGGRPEGSASRGGNRNHRNGHERVEQDFAPHRNQYKPEKS